MPRVLHFLLYTPTRFRFAPCICFLSPTYSTRFRFPHCIYFSSPAYSTRFRFPPCIRFSSPTYSTRFRFPRCIRFLSPTYSTRLRFPPYIRFISPTYSSTRFISTKFHQLIGIFILRPWYPPPLEHSTPIPLYIRAFIPYPYSRQSTSSHL
jgi:hypothetical protein